MKRVAKPALPSWLDVLWTTSTSCLRVGLAVILACIGWPVSAMLSIPDRYAELNPPRFIWQDHKVIEMSGVPMHLRTFSTPDPVPQAAQALAGHTDLFQRVLSVDRKVVLSGMQSGWHWLAHVDASPSGAKGYVSALPMTAKHRVSDTPSFVWLPPQARRRFDHQDTVGSTRVIQQIYSAPLGTLELTAYVRRQLRTQGWVAEPLLATGNVWRRGSARLTLYPLRIDAGTSLYVHYVE